MKQLNDFGFYLVTYPSISRNGNISDVKNAVEAGCKIVQYREKNKTTKEMIIEAEKLKEICNGKALLLIDDHVDVALAVNEKDYTGSVVDLNTYQEKGIFIVGKKPQAVDSNTEKHLAAVVNTKDNSVTVINLQTDEIYTIPVKKHPIAIALNP